MTDLTDFKETEIGPIPVDWEVARLGDVLNEVNVRAKDMQDIDPDHVPILSLTKDRGLILQSERFGKRIATADVSKYKVMRRGWIVYNPYVIWEGAICALRDRDYGLVSPVYLVWEADGADAFFLDYLLRTPMLLSTYLRFCSGTVKRRRSIPKTAFRDIEIPLPPLPEQRRIAHVFSTIQRAIAAQDDLIVAAREVKRSLMQRLFTYGPGPEPVPTKETEIGEIPGYWEVVQLGDVLQTTQYGLSVRADRTGTYPMLRMNNLEDGRIDASDLKYVDLGEDEFAKFRVHERDVLFNRTNSYELVGKTAIFDIEGGFVFASYLIRVVPDAAQLLPEYLNYYLNWDDAQRRLKMLATRGVSQSNISATKLKRFAIGLPSITEQEEIAHILSAADRKIEAEKQRRATLQALFKAMLHQLMTGQVRAPDTVEVPQ